MPDVKQIFTHIYKAIKTDEGYDILGSYGMTYLNPQFQISVQGELTKTSRCSRIVAEAARSDREIWRFDSSHLDQLQIIGVV